MKISITYMIVLLSAMISFGQTKSKLSNKLTPLRISTIESILIRKADGTKDPLKYLYRQLDYKQCVNFVETFNKARPLGPSKYIVMYWVDVYMLDGTKRTFRASRDHVKENNDHAFKLKDEKFIEKIWETAMPLKSVN